MRAMKFALNFVWTHLVFEKRLKTLVNAKPQIFLKNDRKKNVKIHFLNANKSLISAQDLETF